MAPASDKYFLQNELLRFLYFYESQSCAELSIGTKKSIPVVTRILNELMEEGYVEANGYAPSTGGRRALNYSLKKDKGFIMSVAMDQLFTKMVLMNLANEPVSIAETIALDLHQAKDALHQLVEAVRRHIFILKSKNNIT